MWVRSMLHTTPTLTTGEFFFPPNPPAPTMKVTYWFMHTGSSFSSLRVTGRKGEKGGGGRGKERSGRGRGEKEEGRGGERGRGEGGGRGERGEVYGNRKGKGEGGEGKERGRQGMRKGEVGGDER